MKIKDKKLKKNKIEVEKKWLIIKYLDCVFLSDKL